MADRDLTHTVLGVLNLHHSYDEWVGYATKACTCGQPWDNEHIAAAVIAALADEGVIPNDEPDGKEAP